MDIKELDKKQLILLTLLITFVVSIATGIVTVSLMQQVPKSVPQTINNIIQRTIENVTTIQVPVFVDRDDKDAEVSDGKTESVFIGNGDVIVSIYSDDQEIIEPISEDLTDENLVEDELVLEIDETEEEIIIEKPKALGQGIIISDVGLILVEADIIKGHDNLRVVLGEIDFGVSILKEFSNGFTILKIVSNQEKEEIDNEEEETSTSNMTASAAGASAINDADSVIDNE